MDTTSNTALAEAPVSWNTRYVDPRGFDCMLTLRGDNLKTVMTTATAALTAMAAQGCKPSNGHAPSAGNGNGSSSSSTQAPMCPTHKTPMKQSQHGGWYCPVRIADDDGAGKPVYCKQKAK